MSVTLVGTGCGDPGNMTIEVRTALKGADVVIGARRLIEDLDETVTSDRRPAIYAREICEMICGILQDSRCGQAGSNQAESAQSGSNQAESAQSGSDQNGSAQEEPSICVAFSGDSGFYSGTRSLLPLLEEAGIEAAVLPGISSIQVFAARLRRPWQDWKLVSAHGTDCDAVAAVMQGQEVFFLTGGKLTPTELCAQLTQAGLGNLQVIVGERLTYEDERIETGTAEEFAKKSFAPLSVMLAEPAEAPPELGPGIDDDMFIRGEVPMTKQTVRAAILAQMQVRRTDTVWDVGAGTGSVSVELAMRAKEGRVYAVERDPDGCLLIRQNREKFRVWNLEPVDGPAPEALGDLPAPDQVFVGGSGGHLKEIIELALQKNPQAAICVSAIVLETMQEALKLMDEAGMRTQVIQVSVSTARKLGSKHMMMAGNPIFIVTGKPLQ